MRTQVFAHKGIIGISSDPKADGLLNDPTQPGQLGFVVSAEHVDVSREAYDLLQTVKKSRDCIGDVDIFQSEKGIIFSWMGGSKRMLNPQTAEGSKDYAPKLMAQYVRDDMNTPQEFIEAVEKMQE